MESALLLRFHWERLSWEGVMQEESGNRKNTVVKNCPPRTTPGLSPNDLLDPLLEQGIGGVKGMHRINLEAALICGTSKWLSPIQRIFPCDLS